MMEVGMQFTHWMEHADDCAEWFDWFATRGIPAAVIMLRNGPCGDRFAVFRRGKIRRRDQHEGSGSIEPKMRISGDVVVLKYCNGYRVEMAG